ncbi:MAG: hypothetical protein H7Z41_09300 [Cytophagales bacterium]|nr:hypothetical protein [Armatimonadota bacterium]
MRLCANCETMVEDAAARLCPNCGAVLPGNPSPPSSPPPPPPPPAQGPPLPLMQGQLPRKGGWPTGPLGVILIVLLAIVGVVALLGLGLFLLCIGVGARGGFQ